MVLLPALFFISCSACLPMAFRTISFRPAPTSLGSKPSPVHFSVRAVPIYAVLGNRVKISSLQCVAIADIQAHDCIWHVQQVLGIPRGHPDGVGPREGPANDSTNWTLKVWVSH